MTNLGLEPKWTLCRRVEGIADLTVSGNPEGLY